MRPYVPRPLWTATTVMLLLAVIVVALMWPRPIDVDSVVGTAAQRVQPGMTLDEAVAEIKKCGTRSLNTYYFSGATQDGRSFTACGDLRYVPPAAEVAWGEIEVSDEDGNSLILDLGEGGSVLHIRLNTPWSLEGWRYALWQNQAGGTPGASEGDTGEASGT
jgi:hypothetical protein